MGEPVRLHAFTARLDRRVTPVGPGLSATRRGTGAVLALRRRLPGYPEGHALLRGGAGSVPGKARLRLSEGDRALQHLVRWRGFPLGGRCRVFRQSAVLQGSGVRHVLRKRSGEGDGRAPEGPGARRFREVRQAAPFGLPRAVHGERGLVPILGLAGRIRASTHGQARRGASRGEEPGRRPGPRGRALPAPGTPARDGLHRPRRPDARRRVTGRTARRRSRQLRAGTWRNCAPTPRRSRHAWAGSSPTTTTTWSGTRMPPRWRSPACSPPSPARTAASTSTRPWGGARLAVRT